VSARVTLLNGRFDPLTLDQTADEMLRLVDEGHRGWVCTVNVAILMMMRSNARLQRFVDRAALVVADGQPLIWAAGWFGGRLPERVAGVELVDALCERAARQGKVVYLLGATTHVLESVVQRLRTRHPRLQLAWADGYFSESEAPLRAQHVSQSGAHVLIGGMGVPRQEYFLEEQWERLGVATAVGVGGSFDVIAGLRKRAPRWMQKVGLEWLFRLAQEPRRLFGRYLVTNAQFLWCILCNLVSGRRQS